jgi:hypothetical protein
MQGDAHSRSEQRDDRPFLGSVGLIGIVSMLLASMWFSPWVVVGISCTLLGSGFALAGWAWLKTVPQNEQRSSVWDFAGLLVLAGFAGLIGANTVLF